MLENDNASVIQLAKQALRILSGEDYQCVLWQLTHTYAHLGQIDNARACLAEYKEKYAFDTEDIELLEQEINDAEKRAHPGGGSPKRTHDEAAITDGTAIPEEYLLSQNYPNPFNPITTIEYSLPEAIEVTVKIFDLLGKEVAVLVNEYQKAGYHQVHWDATGHASGVYFYQIQAGRAFREIRKMILLR